MDWGLHLHEEFYDDLVFYPGSGEAIKDPCRNFVQGLEGIAFARQPKFDTTELIMYCPRLSPFYEDKPGVKVMQLVRDC